MDRTASLLERGLARVLRPFAKVEPEEATATVAMTFIVFFLLTAYYLLKTAREPLILLQGGAEVKSYAAAGQAMLLLGVVRAYSELAQRVGRMRLLAIVYLFFTSNLLVFAALARTKLHIGVAFFLWVGDRALLASVDASGLRGTAAQIFVGAFKADYFSWFNLVGVLLQLFAVSRIMGRLGVRNALLFLPGVAFIGYGLIIFAPVLALIRAVKIVENSLDYSLQNTARQALYLVTSRVEKYVGKTTVDTFIVRVGDVLSAVVVWTGARLGLPTAGFAAINVVLITLWVGCVLAIGREHARRSDESDELVSAEPGPYRLAGLEQLEP